VLSVLHPGLTWRPPRCLMPFAAFWLVAFAQGALIAHPLGGVQQNQPPRDAQVASNRSGTAVIRGRVVDGRTGNPVARARVRLTSPSPATRQSSMLTDGEGAFEFTALVPDFYIVTVEKSTYATAQYPDLTRSMRSRGRTFSIADREVVEGLTISLYPAGAITGRVFDAYGDPLERAQVRAFRYRGGRFQGLGWTQTNDVGEYRLPRLEPGRYVVQVRPQLNQVTKSSQPDSERLPSQPLPVFYPNATHPTQARTVTVKRGETLYGVDIFAGEGVPTIVSGVVIRPDGEPAASGFIQAVAVGHGIYGGYDEVVGTSLDKGGTFQLTLPPGEYLLVAQLQPRLTPKPVASSGDLTGVARVVASGHRIENVFVVAGAGATVSGRVVFEGGTPPPPSPGEARVPFSDDFEAPGCRLVNAKVGEDWTFKVENLVGTCGVSPLSDFGAWSLKAVIINGENVVDRKVSFEIGQQLADVRVVVSDKRSEINLIVTDDEGKPTQEYVALVFPVDKQRWKFPSRFMRTLVPLIVASGTAPRPESNAMNLWLGRMVGLPTGDYYAIAVDDIDSLDWQDLEILERLADSAVRVTVTDEGAIEVPLRRLSFADVMR